MYRLKKSEDLGFIVGSTIEQVCASNTTLTINGDRDSYIRIFSGFSITTRTQSCTVFNGSAEDASVLLQLIGDVVEAATATDEGGLRVNFRSGLILDVFDDSDQYESFVIGNGDKQIIV
jgi:hypothetical protein